MSQVKVTTRDLYFKIIMTVFETVNETSVSQLLTRILATLTDEQKLAIAKELPSKSENGGGSGTL